MKDLPKISCTAALSLLGVLSFYQQSSEAVPTFCLISGISSRSSLQQAAGCSDIFWGQVGVWGQPIEGGQQGMGRQWLQDS